MYKKTTLKNGLRLITVPIESANSVTVLILVGTGSKHETKFIIVEYWGDDKDKKPSVLVGKGITFDSGGYHLKPMKFIETMQQDMAGCAVVMGLFHLLKKFGILRVMIKVIGFSIAAF